MTYRIGAFAIVKLFRFAANFRLQLFVFFRDQEPGVDAAHQADDGDKDLRNEENVLDVENLAFASLSILSLQEISD